MTYQELVELNKNRRIFQICIVTTDIEKTMRDMIDYLSIGPWRMLTLSDETVRDAKVMVNDETIDNDKPFKFFVAVCMVGDVQFELIQPVYGDTMYQKFLDAGREGLHHFKEKIAMEDWDTIRDKFIKKGINVTSSGWVGQSFFAYFNTEPVLRFDLEIGNCPDINVLPECYNVRCFPEQ